MSTLSIKQENQPTYIVAVFVLSLLALVFTFYNSQKIKTVAQFYGITSMQSMKSLTDQMKNTSATMATLEVRIATLEGQGAGVVSEVPVQ